MSHSSNGSAVLTSADAIPTAVHEIYRWYREGHRVLVVVSAVANATDELLDQARELADSDKPDAHATAELLATGERYSAALMGIALHRASIPACVLDLKDIPLLDDKGFPLPAGDNDRWLIESVSDDGIDVSSLRTHHSRTLAYRSHPPLHERHAARRRPARTFSRVQGSGRHAGTRRRSSCAAQAAGSRSH